MGCASETQWRAFILASGGAPRPDTFRILGSQIPPGHLEIIIALEVHPELRTIAEVQAQPQRGVGRDASSIVDDLGDSVRRNTDRFREPVLGEPIFGQELL